MRTLLLFPHVIAGCLGLIVGPIAMAVNKRTRRKWHRSAGFLYQACTAILCLSALGLTALDFSGLWWLGLIAIATEAAALTGWWAMRRRPRLLLLHVNMMCSSYISFVTAFLVVNFDSLIAWFLPTIIGAPLIALAIRKARNSS